MECKGSSVSALLFSVVVWCRLKKEKSVGTEKARRDAMKDMVKKFWKDERGLETVEYAIIAGLVVAGTIAAITAIGLWVRDQFNGLQGELGA